MSFLNPLFLFALIAVGLPLLIHLLNLRRPQKVSFSTLAFFQELKNTTIKRIRIKRFLLLFLRLLAIICLALVLARPFLPPALSGGGSAQAPALNAVLLDNSISMSRIGSQGPLIDQAKGLALEIAESAKDEDRFLVQSTNGESGLSTILNKGNYNRSVNEIEVVAAGNFITDRLTTMVEMVREAPYQVKNIFIITDGQQTQLHELQGMDLENVSFTVIDVGAVKVQNTVLTGVSTNTNMLGVNIPFTLNVKLTNESEVPAANQFVSLEFEDENAGQYSVSLAANESKIFSFEIAPSETGSAKGKIVIEGDEFQADNVHYFTVQVPERRNILWIKPKTSSPEFISYTGAMLSAAGENDAQLKYIEETPDILETADLSKFDTILLDGLEEIPEFSFSTLQDYAQNGGGILFFPSEKGSISNYNAFLSEFNVGRFGGLQGEYASFKSIARADEILEDHPAFSGLFEKEGDEELRFTTPDIYYYFKFLTNGSGTSFDLLDLNNGDVAVHEKRVGEGTLVVSAFGNDPGWTNFAVKPLFAPFYYRLLLYSASSDRGGFADHELGNEFVWQGNIDAEDVVIKTENDVIKPTTDVVPAGIRVRYPATEWKPGWFTLTDEDRTYILSANLPIRESDFLETNEDRLEVLLQDADINWINTTEIDEENLAGEIMASGFGKEIWNWFMLAGFLFLITETLVSMWYKAETVS
jgi:hypothetical protein